MTFKRNEFPQKLYKKFEKYSGSLYGIQVAGKEVQGTRVRQPDGKEGVVCSVNTQHCDKLVYTVRWADGSECLYATYQVLEHAVVGQRVVSSREDRENFKHYLCAMMAVEYVHVYLFATQDDNQNKKRSKGSKLRAQAETNKEEAVRDFVWKTIKHLKAVDTVNDHECKLVESDECLKAELDKKGSLLKTLRLSDEKEGLLKHTNLKFNPKHKRSVRHVLRGHSKHRN